MDHFSFLGPHFICYKQIRFCLKPQPLARDATRVWFWGAKAQDSNGAALSSKPLPSPQKPSPEELSSDIAILIHALLWLGGIPICIEPFSTKTWFIVYTYWKSDSLFNKEGKSPNGVGDVMNQHFHTCAGFDDGTSPFALAWHPKAFTGSGPRETITHWILGMTPWNCVVLDPKCCSFFCKKTPCGMGQDGIVGIGMHLMVWVTWYLRWSLFIVQWTSPFNFKEGARWYVTLLLT